jgi:hypothetical protein
VHLNSSSSGPISRRRHSSYACSRRRKFGHVEDDEGASQSSKDGAAQARREFGRRGRAVNATWMRSLSFCQEERMRMRLKCWATTIELHGTGGRSRLIIMCRPVFSWQWPPALHVERRVQLNTGMHPCTEPCRHPVGAWVSARATPAGATEQMAMCELRLRHCINSRKQPLASNSNSTPLLFVYSVSPLYLGSSLSDPDLLLSLQLPSMS